MIQPLLQWGVEQPDLRAYRFIAPIVVAGWPLTGVFTLALSALESGGSHGFHVVYVASFRTAGVHDPEQIVRRAGWSVARSRIQRGWESYVPPRPQWRVVGARRTRD